MGATFNELTDESPMPYGKHKGTKMKDLNDEYLKFLYDNNRCSGNVMRYILRKMEEKRKQV